MAKITLKTIRFLFLTIFNLTCGDMKMMLIFLQKKSPQNMFTEVLREISFSDNVNYFLTNRLVCLILSETNLMMYVPDGRFATLISNRSVQSLAVYTKRPVSV